MHQQKMVFKQASVLFALLALLWSGAVASQQQKLFAELLSDAKAGVAGIASSQTSHYAPADVKELSLQEAKVYNCRTVGCQEVADCRSKRESPPSVKQSGPCPDCVTRIVFQSDLTCGSTGHGYGYGADSSPDGAGFDSPYLKIGTCNWDVLVPPEFTCWIEPANPSCAGVEPPFADGQTYTRLGSAWATCHLASGAEMCDDALCRMVLTIQGGLYLTPARSTQLLSLANNANPEDTCGPALGEFGVRVGGPAKAANIGIGSGTDGEPELFTGVALMVSGTVTATSLERRMEYPLGHVDYVYDFKLLDAALLQQLGFTDVESFPRVRPNSYNMKLVAKRKQATY